jgi:tetratricopeptide (TPR) repeat protein
VREQLAFLCVAGGDWEGAREHFAWLAAARPGDASAGYNLACALSRLGRFDEALEALAGAAGDPDLRELARGDPDLAALRADPERAARVAEVLAGP